MKIFKTTRTLLKNNILNICTSIILFTLSVYNIIIQSNISLASLGILLSVSSIITYYYNIRNITIEINTSDNSEDDLTNKQLYKDFLLEFYTYMSNPNEDKEKVLDMYTNDFFNTCNKK
jgi:hypothetical protein